MGEVSCHGHAVIEKSKPLAEKRGFLIGSKMLLLNPLDMVWKKKIVFTLLVIISMLGTVSGTRQYSGASPPVEKNHMMVADQDNPNRDNPNTSTGTDHSLLLRMDIGYHYFGSLRHPREVVPDIGVFETLEPWEEPDWYYPTFAVAKAHQVAIASGAYNSQFDFPDTTIATFPADYILGVPPSERYTFFLFHQFRSQNNNGSIAVYGPVTVGGYDYSWPLIERVAMTATTQYDNPPGVIYAACTVNWAKDDPAYFGRSGLFVYRYNDAQGTWTQIGEHVIPVPGPYGPMPFCTEVALAARNEDLWVFWMEVLPVGEEQVEQGIYGDRIVDAATINTEQLIGNANWLWPLTIQGVQEQALDADWDPNRPGIGNPRIIWSEVPQQGGWDTWESWVDLWPNGDPQELADVQPVAVDPEIEYTYPAIAVNQLFNVSTQQAFASFVANTSTPAMTNTLINDTWGQPFLFNAPTEQDNREWPDVSSRFFETRRICFKGYRLFYHLFTNTEWINPEGPKIEGHYPRISTNGANLIDQFLVFSSQYDPYPLVESTIDLFQIDP